MEARLVEGDGGVAILVRAALPAVPGVNLLPGIRKTGGDDLTGLAFRRPPLEIRRERVTAPTRSAAFRSRNGAADVPAPPGLPAPLAGDDRAGFPFPAMGAVHLTNTITAHRAMAVGETVEVSVRPENLRPHAKGRTVDFVTEVTAGGERCGRAARPTCVKAQPMTRGRPMPQPLRSTKRPDLGPHLAAGGRPQPSLRGGVRRPQPDPHLRPDRQGPGLRPPDRARHLVKARCVAALENRLPEAVTVEVAFPKPIFLPGKVAFGSVPTDDGFASSSATRVRRPSPPGPDQPRLTPRLGPLLRLAHGSTRLGRRDRAGLGPRCRLRRGGDGAPHRLPDRGVQQPRRRRGGRGRPRPGARRPGVHDGRRGRGGPGLDAADAAALRHRRAPGRAAPGERGRSHRRGHHRRRGLLPRPAPAGRGRAHGTAGPPAPSSSPTPTAG